VPAGTVIQQVSELSKSDQDTVRKLVEHAETVMKTASLRQAGIVLQGK
jgi:hypothetical protein